MSKQHDDLAIERLQALMQKHREGKLSLEEKQQLDQCCAEDPFLAEALEGMAYATDSNTFEEDVEMLRQQVRQKVHPDRADPTFLWRMAATVALLLVCGYGLYYLTRPDKNPDSDIAVSKLSQAPHETEEAVVKPETPAQLKSLSPLSLADNGNGKKALQKRLYQKVNPVPVPQEKLADVSTDHAVAEDKVIESVASSAPVQDTSAVGNIVVQNLPSSMVSGFARSANERSKAETQWRTIAGHVYNADDHTPLPGVNVVLKDNKLETMTDIDGNFVLQIPEAGQLLVFSLVGYDTQEINIPQQDSVDVYLSPEIASLSEVVVVGYGTPTREAISGSVSSVRPEEGMKNFKDYVQENLRYPAAAKARGVEGVVKVEFTVATDGSLSHFTIKKSLGYGCDEEAIRLIKEGPAWQPATENGQAIAQQVTVRIKFKL